MRHRVVFDAADGVRVHQEEMQIRLPGAAGIAGALGHGGDAGGIEADVEHRVHHAGHRVGGAGAHRDQQRLIADAEGAPRELFEAFEIGVQFGVEIIGPALLVFVEVGAAFGGDGEAGRHVEAGARHVREAGAFAADQVLDIAVAVGLAVAEEVDPALWHAKVPFRA